MGHQTVFSERRFGEFGLSMAVQGARRVFPRRLPFWRVPNGEGRSSRVAFFALHKDTPMEGSRFNDLVLLSTSYKNHGTSNGLEHHAHHSSHIFFLGLPVPILQQS